MSRIIRNETVPASVVQVKESTARLVIDGDRALTVVRVVSQGGRTIERTDPVLVEGADPAKVDSYEYPDGFAGTQVFPLQDILAITDAVTVGGVTVRVCDLPALVSAAVEVLADRMAHDAAAVVAAFHAAAAARAAADEAIRAAARRAAPATVGQDEPVVVTGLDEGKGNP